MKRYFPITAAGLLFILGMVAASLFGCVSHPPTALEQKYFNITTNPPVISVTTNFIPVTLYKTNEVVQTVTNLQNVVEFRTNYVPVAVATNVEARLAVVTNQPETYNFAPGPGQQNIKDIGGLIGSFFGAGGIATTAIGALFSIWGLVRSKKNYGTAAQLAQTIETLRTFVQQLPNGPAYDTALVQWMQQHQAETGTINQIIGLLANEVSNPDAQVAAEHIRAAIAALGVTLPPPPPRV